MTKKFFFNKKKFKIFFAFYYFKTKLNLLFFLFKTYINNKIKFEIND